MSSVKAHPKVTLVVPNLKLAQLEWFFAENWKVLQDEVTSDELALVVVSSALNADDLAVWQTQYSKVVFVCLENNRGFAQTVNTGFRRAHSEWVGTVNDDVQLSLGWWQACLANADHQTGSINPVIKNLDGAVESAGITILPRGKAEPIRSLSRFTAKESSHRVDATNGACVLYRASALEKVGLYDERFGSYLEDIDLSLRLAQAGYTNRVCLTASVTHAGHASGLVGRRNAWLDAKNWWLVVLKNWSAQQWRNHWFEILLERGRNLSGVVKAYLRM